MKNFESKKTIIIFGKNGQIASDLIALLSYEDEFDIHIYSSNDIDFTNLKELKNKLGSLPKSDFIINATAYNLVDLAEKEKNKADLINHKAVDEIASHCQKYQIKFIHYSTNYVFDGKSDKPYKEDNLKNLNPLSIYGKSKLDGEVAIIKSNCEYLILRVATVFNLNKENNFVFKIKKLAQNNKELKVISDQITNPTNSFDIAKATIDIIKHIIKNNKFISGIYHLASKNPISYYEFAKIITSEMKDIKITEVNSSYFPSIAKRPLNGALNVDKIKKDFEIEIKQVKL